jgi:hypothetical protein
MTSDGLRFRLTRPSARDSHTWSKRPEYIGT